jgi:hypothetical protein
MQFRTFFATFIFCTCFIELPEALADATACYQTYTNDTGVCSTAQQNRDNAAWNLWETNNEIVTATLNSYLAQDLTNFNNSISQCQTNYQNAIATCSSNYNVAAAAAYNTESNQLTACQSQYSDIDPRLYVCACPVVAAYNYANAAAQASYNLCVGVAADNDGGNTTYINLDGLCDGTAIAIKSKSDSWAYAGYNYICGKIDALCDATRTLSDNFTAPLCYAQASYNYANCLLDVDCSQTPGNCCQDGCAKTYNNGLLSAVSSYANTVGPAYYTYTYNVEMCSVNQQEQDAVAQYTAQFAIDNAWVKCLFDQDEAFGKHYYAVTMAAATANQAIAICLCNAFTGAGFDTNSSQYASCVTQALVTQTNSDASALAAEDQVVDHWLDNIENGTWVNGSAWVAYHTTETNALAAAQATYTADYSQMTNCVANEQTTINSVTYAANVQYNNDTYAAVQTLVSCLQDCNDG